MTSLRKQVRIQQTLGEIERLQNEFDDWQEHRKETDEKQQYKTQLDALHDVVAAVLVDIGEDTKSITKDNPDLGALYARCGLQEKRILWVRRVLWGYFREKFDQRDQSDKMRKLLEAADDVVWSCYSEVKEKLAPEKPLKPIPLVYIEPFYSPQALPRDEPPDLLKERRLGADFISEFFNMLPIPLIGVPPITETMPWWLVYLGHEVGHHVQHDFDLVGPFSNMLFDIAKNDPHPKENLKAAQRWYNWGQEIFSDVFSVYMMGAGAVSAMTELETHPDRDMMIRKEAYPSPAARLVLLAKVANELGLEGTAALRGEDAAQRLAKPPADDFETELQQELTADLAMIDKLVDTLITEGQTIGEVASFAKMTRWNGSDLLVSKGLGDWKKFLIKDQKSKAKQALSSARLIISAGVEAWSAITKSVSAEKWDQTAKTLGSRILDGIEKYRDKTTRNADTNIIQSVGAVAAEISGKLRKADFSEW